MTHLLNAVASPKHDINTDRLMKYMLLAIPRSSWGTGKPAASAGRLAGGMPDSSAHAAWCNSCSAAALFTIAMWSVSRDLSADPKSTAKLPPLHAACDWNSNVRWAEHPTSAALRLPPPSIPPRPHPQGIAVLLPACDRSCCGRANAKQGNTFQGVTACCCSRKHTRKLATSASQCALLRNLHRASSL